MICICDIDGVLADSTERFARATKDGKIDWHKALNGQYIYLDKIIPGAKEAMETLHSQCSEVILLTSRPWHMEYQSEAWLRDCGIPYHRIVTKPEKVRYKKTMDWKAEEVVKIAHSCPNDTLLIIDDEECNRMTIGADMLRAGMYERCRVYASLQDSLAQI